MADLDIACTITRAQLGQSDLALESSSYEVVTAGPGDRTPRLDEVTGRYMNGSAVLNVTWERGTLPLVIRVKASSASQLASRTTTLVKAFSQRSFDLTLTIDGQTSTWKCHAATISAGDTLNKYELMELMQTYTLAVPRQPTPVVGPM